MVTLFPYGNVMPHKYSTTGEENVSGQKDAEWQGGMHEAMRAPTSVEGHQVVLWTSNVPGAVRQVRI